MKLISDIYQVILMVLQQLVLSELNIQQRLFEEDTVLRVTTLDTNFLLFAFKYLIMHVKLFSITNSCIKYSQIISILYGTSHR